MAAGILNGKQTHPDTIRKINELVDTGRYTLKQIGCEAKCSLKTARRYATLYLESLQTPHVAQPIQVISAVPNTLVSVLDPDLVAVQAIRDAKTENQALQIYKGYRLIKNAA